MLSYVSIISRGGFIEPFHYFLYWFFLVFGLIMFQMCLCTRRKCCVGFALRKKSVWCCFHADTMFSAGIPYHT